MPASGTGKCRSWAGMLQPTHNGSDQMAIKHALPMAAGLLLGLLVAVPAASADDLHCNVSSDYDLTLNPRSLILIRASGTPQRLVLRQGALFVDDRWVAVSADDRARLIQFERQTRDVVPLAQEVGREAADIAVTALGEVAAGFAAARGHACAAGGRARKDRHPPEAEFRQEPAHLDRYR